MRKLFLFFALVLLISIEGITQGIVRIGSGYISYQGSNGIASSSDLLFPLGKNFSVGGSIGFAMAADKNLSTTVAGSYLHNSLFRADLVGEYALPIKALRFSVSAGAGFRHLLSTDILTNSNQEVTPYNGAYSGFAGFGGFGIDYVFSEKISFGVNYNHEFYHEGFDYFGVRIGFGLR